MSASLSMRYRTSRRELQVKLSRSWILRRIELNLSIGIFIPGVLMGCGGIGTSSTEGHSELEVVDTPELVIWVCEGDLWTTDGDSPRVMLTAKWKPDSVLGDVGCESVSKSEMVFALFKGRNDMRLAPRSIRLNVVVVDALVWLKMDLWYLATYPWRNEKPLWESFRIYSRKSSFDSIWWISFGVLLDLVGAVLRILYAVNNNHAYNIDHRFQKKKTYTFSISMLLISFNFSVTNLRTSVSRLLHLKV